MIANLDAEPGAQGVASVLIVEDEAVVALDLKFELQSLGYRVVGIADTADDAVRLARSQRPSLALMDVMLKGTGDGIQAASVLGAELGIPVVFLTSFSDAVTVQRAAEAAPYGYLTKPFQIRELRAGIEIALYKSRMERHLRESERWFASTLRCVQDGVVVVDRDGRVRFTNRAAQTLLGCSRDEAAGQPVEQVVRLDAGVDARALLVNALSQGHVIGVEYGRHLIVDGARVAVDTSAAPVHDDKGQPLGAVLVLRDARDRLQQEARLRHSEARFRAAFDLAPLGMALVALDGRFLQVNEALCRLLQTSSDFLIADSDEALTHGDDREHERACLMRLQTHALSVTQFEKRYVAAGGAPVWTMVSASLLKTDDQPTCYLYQIHDLTDQRAAAAQLAALTGERIKREASEMAERRTSEFLSRVSHEMRTPLNAVLGFAQLLQARATDASEPNSAYSKYIIEAGQHMLALVDDVLDVQRASRGDLQLQASNVMLDKALPEALNMLSTAAADREVTLAHQAEPGLCVHTDATRLRQVLLNILSNAIKYNVQGGSVVLAASALEAGQVVISVKDSGIGMTTEQLEHLYEPFNRLGRESLRMPGTGLGLVITRKLVDVMGGSMTVESQPHVGTVVKVRFDLAKC